MIVIYKRGDWDWMRIEDAKTIFIGEVSKLEEHHKEALDNLQKISEEISRINVLLRDIAFNRIGRITEMLISDKLHKSLGYKYVVITDTSWGSYSFLTKSKGKEEEIKKLFSNKKIKFVYISEENGIEKVELEK